VSCGKTAEPIEMPFWGWTEVGPRNQALDGVQIPTCEGAVLRAKGAAQTCPAVDVFKATQWGAALVRCGCHFGCTRWDVRWCHLANAIEPSVYLSHAALCQTAFQHCTVRVCTDADYYCYIHLTALFPGQPG